MNEILHFAYGANLASSALAWRRIAPRAFEPARALGVRMVFDAEGMFFPFLEPAFANLVDDASATTHGVLYRLEPEDWKRLQRSEAGYDVVELDVGGRTALGFRCPRRARIRKPSQRYLELVVAGARERGLPVSWIDELERVETFHLPIASAVAGLALERVGRRVWSAWHRA